MYWGRSNVILSLEQFAEAEPTRFADVTQAVLKYLLELKRRITSPDYATLAGWAAQRWMDIALGAEVGFYGLIWADLGANRLNYCEWLRQS